MPKIFKKTKINKAAEPLPEQETVELCDLRKLSNGDRDIFMAMLDMTMSQIKI